METFYGIFLGLAFILLNTFRTLTSITIPDSVTSIGENVFKYCNSLTNIEVDKNNKVYDSRDNCNAIIETKTNSLLLGCKNTIIPNSVTCIGNSAFYNCSNLTSIAIPNSVTSIGNYSFYECSNLTSITIPDSVTSIGNSAFFGCNSLTNMTIPFIGNKLEGTINTHFGCIFGASRFETNSRLVPSTLKSVIITSAMNIPNSAFNYCSSLTSITIPESVTSISDEAFSNCDNLEYNIYDNVKYLGNNNNPYLCLIGATSKSITSCTINDNCKAMAGGAFYNCSNLASITISDNVMSISNAMFWECSNLRSVIIGSSVTSIGKSSFYNCSKLTEVYYNGSENDWSNITGTGNNSNLTDATRYYYSETEPSLNDDETAYNGNYWHYDTDGKTIVEWIK